MNIGYRIKQRREELGYTQPELAKLVGVAKGTIGNYEAGISFPNEKTLIALFNVLKCDANYLYQDSFDKESLPFSFEENNIIKKYRVLDDHGKKIVNINLNEEYERCLSNNNNNNRKFIELNLYEFPASAGPGVLLFDEQKEKVQVVASPIATQADFLLRVRGDSMEPKYRDDDIVFIKATPEISIGEIGIFIVNNEGFIKRLGNNCLISLNNKYKDINFKEFDSIICVGKVLGVLQ